jgi:uncharacterized membrane protein
MTDISTTPEDRRRITSVDLLRGLVMIIMLLDHVRDYVFAGGLTNNPTDLTKTNVVLFFTRWITHFCAPTFVFLSGTSIYLQRLRGKSNGELSRFLLTRGLWLIVLEFTVVRFSLFLILTTAFSASQRSFGCLGCRCSSSPDSSIYPKRQSGRSVSS